MIIKLLKGFFPIFWISFFIFTTVTTLMLGSIFSVALQELSILTPDEVKESKNLILGTSLFVSIGFLIWVIEKVSKHIIHK